MSDVPPPPGGLPEPEAATTEVAGGLWHRYRSLPVWLQVLIPLVLVAVIGGVIVWATGGGSDGDIASSETTTASGDDAIEVVVKGLIVAGALTDPSVPTTGAPATTPEPTSTPTTPTAASTTGTTGEPATTPPPTTSAPDTTEEPPDTTEPSDTTEPPDTTDAPDTTDVPETDPPDTTEEPTTTTGATPALPSVAAFFAQWNDAAVGTDVPTIRLAEARELTGDYAGFYVLPLTAGDSNLPPQVGLVGTATAPGSGQLDEVMLAWIPGADEESTTFYWDCFGVLVEAVSPGATADEIADLASALGEAPDTPPFTRTANVSSGGLDFRAFILPYTGEAGTLDVSAIEVG